MRPSADLLIRNVEVARRRGTFDVVIKDGAVINVVPAGTTVEGSQLFHSIDGQGGVLLPGLHDHHLHLMSMAARATSLDCSRAAVGNLMDLRRTLEDADRRLIPGAWLRGVGYDDVSLPRIDRSFLDSVVPDRPVRVQHRTGHAWIFNSRALDLLRVKPGQRGVERDAKAMPTGWLFGGDALLRQVINEPAPPLSTVGGELSRYGITAVTDASADNDDTAVEHFVEAIRTGELQQRIQVMGRRLTPVSNAKVRVGPVKIVLAEYDLPGLAALVASVERAHRRRSNVAIHAVSREALLLALTALEESGGGTVDRIEHASLAPGAVLGRLADLGPTVVTQFNFLHDHGDLYADQLSPEQTGDLYRGRSWTEAGVTLAGGSDAPFGSSDPWLAMRSAVKRRTSSGLVLNEWEALSPEQALDLYLSPLESAGTGIREVRKGVPADLCLLRVPWSIARQRLDAELVAATIIGGKVVYLARGFKVEDIPRGSGSPARHR
jgi:predicted amidohydrolase YtcJ